MTLPTQSPHPIPLRFLRISSKSPWSGTSGTRKASFFLLVKHLAFWSHIFNTQNTLHRPLADSVIESSGSPVSFIKGIFGILNRQGKSWLVPSKSESMAWTNNNASFESWRPRPQLPNSTGFKLIGTDGPNHSFGVSTSSRLMLLRKEFSYISQTEAGSSLWRSGYYSAKFASPTSCFLLISLPAGWAPKYLNFQLCNLRKREED